jgi:hypothetical protein
VAGRCFPRIPLRIPGCRRPPYLPGQPYCGHRKDFDDEDCESHRGTRGRGHGGRESFYPGELGRGKTVAFLKTAGGQFRTLAYPGASATSAFGVNGSDEVNDFGQLVGFYVDANGNTDGLLATPGR